MILLMALRSRTKKPLNAYNLLYKVERQRILRGLDDHPRNNEETIITRQEVYQALQESNQRSGNKRAHRKTQGMIGFDKLRAKVSQKWRNLDDQSRAVLKHCAAVLANESNHHERRLGQEKKLSASAGVTTTSIDENILSENESSGMTRMIPIQPEPSSSSISADSHHVCHYHGRPSSSQPAASHFSPNGNASRSEHSSELDQNIRVFSNNLQHYHHLPNVPHLSDGLSADARMNEMFFPSEESSTSSFPTSQEACASDPLLGSLPAFFVATARSQEDASIANEEAQGLDSDNLLQPLDSQVMETLFEDE